MTRQEFVDKYNGVPVDYDGVYGAQCVDLIRQYLKDVFGFTKEMQPEPVVGAADFFFLHNERPVQRELFNCVPYTGTIQPPVGSLLIFKSSDGNRYGHIAICFDADRLGMTVFEQDGVVNERALREGREQKGACVGHWGYDRLVGWLMPKEA